MGSMITVHVEWNEIWREKEERKEECVSAWLRGGERERQRERKGGDRVVILLAVSLVVEQVLFVCRPQISL